MVATDAGAGGTHHVVLPGIGDVAVEVADRGAGQAFLLLHGGAGPASWAGFAATLAAGHPARALVPTHPGFARTPRPESLRTVRGLAELYDRVLRELPIENVTVVGNSIGGWIAAELALLHPPPMSRLVLVGASGVDVPGLPLPDVSKLSVDELMALSYHDPKPFRIDPATLTADQRATIASNRAALQVYSPATADPTLAARLSRVAVPTLVVVGAADRIVPHAVGQAYATAIPGSRLVQLADTGHLPQIETPDLFLSTLWKFAAPP
jgi:pimeloyl-ACP methyl ester carboxylesterase